MQCIVKVTILTFGAVVNADSSSFGSGGELNSDGKHPKVTDEQVAEFMKDFKDFDSNRDGKLDAQEVLGNFKGEVENKELWEFFRMADKNIDGKVSDSEYIDYAADLTSNSKEEM